MSYLRRGCLAILILLVLAGLGWFFFVAQNPEARLLQGREALAAGRFEEAESLGDQLRMGGHFDHAALLEAEALLLEGQPKQAMDRLAETRTEGALKLQAANLVGRCFLQMNDLFEADRAFSFVLSQSPNDLDAHRGLAAVYHDSGALANALEECQEWAKLSPRDGRPGRMSGAIFKDLKRYPEAIDAYKKTLGKDVKDLVRAEVRIELAECLLKTGEAEQGLTYLEDDVVPEALRLAYLTAKADCLRNLGRTQEALGLADEASVLDPRLPRVLRLRAQLQIELGKSESALALLQNASAIAPKELETHFLLAQVFNQLGRAADAKRHQQFVQEIQTDLDEMQKLNGELLANPRSPDLHHRIAAVYEKLDMPAMASQRRHTAALLARSRTAGKLEPTPSRP